MKPFKYSRYIFVILFRVHRCIKMDAGTKRIRKLKYNKTSYKDLVKFDIPRRTRRRTTGRANKLYPLRIINTSENGDRVKVHYIGYAAVYDEWRKIRELEDIETPSEGTGTSRDQSRSERQSEVYSPYSPYNNLRVQIKKSIICSRTRTPKVHTTLQIDILIFDGGLKMAQRKL